MKKISLHTKYHIDLQVVDNSLLEDLRLRMQASQRETELLRAEKQELEQKLQGYIANWSEEREIERDWEEEGNMEPYFVKNEKN